MTDVRARLSAALTDRYAIERELGAGGMATVYLARDLRHHRRVALKVLRPELAAVIGAERFLHEITTTANLQHPHILPLHDSGTVDGTVFYVMPFVEGESLRDRLTREKQLPVDDAVRIAREVAGALDYAHRHGVIHRDIKPENILLHDGQALVADFGIALAAAKTGSTRMTETGMSLGTPTYMSPEQAMGERTLDPRTDVYALGCVLYEMLAGEPPFTGPTAQSIVAKVMTEAPRPVRSLRQSVPLNVNAALARALEKLPADRFSSAAELAQALSDPAFRTAPGSTVEAAGVRSGRSRSRYAVAAAMLLLALLAAWGWLRPVPKPLLARFNATLDGADFASGTSDPPAVSPDGRSFAYADGRNTLSLRRIDQLRATPVPAGTTGWAGFFSPDGTSLGFATGFPGDLRLVTLATGTVTTVARDSVVGDGADWSDDGWVYYTAGTPRTLYRVRPTGETPELVTRADTTQEELFFRWPHALPGGRAVLITIWYRRQPPAIALVDVRNHRTRILTPGVRAWFTPTGHLVVVRGDGSIAAARFDPSSSDPPDQLVELVPKGGVLIGYGGAAMVAISRSGTMMYVPQFGSSRVVRVDRSGGGTTVDPAWEADVIQLTLSPDGSRVAVATVVDGRAEIWLKQLDAGPFTRLWAAGSQGYRPFWTSDGKWVGFASDASGVMSLYRVSADGAGAAERLSLPGRSVDEGQWSRDGHWLVFRIGSGGGRDILGLRPGVDSAPTPLAATDAEEFSPTLSPDGRWLAYGSDASGRDEIYVRPFPATLSGRVQVSLAGGTEPLWSNRGNELFYRDLAGDLIAVAVASGADFRVQSRRALFSARQYQTDSRNRAYTVSPDASWFLFAELSPRQVNELIVVQNWFEELKARVP